MEKENSRDVDMLMDAFDTFQKASTTLECHYKGLEKRIGELNIELVEKNNYLTRIKRLRESIQRDKRLRAMGEMAASLAHQIRNPLGSIELFASLLNDELSEDREKQGIANEIVQAVRSLNTTLSNMLLFANISKPSKSMVSIEELTNETIGICNFLLHDKAVTIDVIHNAPHISLLVDRELLKQAILNLIINGIEAVNGKADGVVSIVSKKESDGIHILVSDNGVGIHEKDMDKVFDPFFTTRSKGTGLGLTVVNNIVEAHGGFIEVESREGMGTTFDITISEVSNPEKLEGFKVQGSRFTV